VAQALRRVLACPEVGDVVVVAPLGHEGELAEAIADLTGGPAGDVSVRVVAGGPERTDSVAAGVAALPARVDLVLVHDAARPLAPPELFTRVVAALRAGLDAVVPGVPVTDTVKQVNARAVVVATPDRSALRAVQTPQGFRRTVLETAHRDTRATATDDATLVERGGGTVHVVAGDARAAKITGPGDLEALEQSLRSSRPPVLLVLGGPPGVGKTHVARAWARRRGAVHLRVDTVEQALLRAGTTREVGVEGYAVARAQAADHLDLGLGVVVDAVHPVAESRAAWRRLAQQTGVGLLTVELRCADDAEHRRRVEQRRADIEGHRLPDWTSVSRLEWEPWPEADLVLDTGTLDAEAVTDRVEALAEARFA
jgi:2-C-methyl-D-erythritol 4-phosphate cytidylyltransferase